MQLRTKGRSRYPIAMLILTAGALMGFSQAESLEPTLESIQENIFTPKCTQCHSGSGAPQGLNLKKGQAEGNLVGVASGEVPDLKRVDPGNPDDSYLIHKLEGTQDVGSRMPIGGSPLSQEQIDAIRQWIADGA